MGAPLADPALHLATAALGAVRLGIPVDAVMQAIPVPAGQALLPRRQGALSGVVLHEGALVPVVDLARWVDVGRTGAERLGSARILVLHQDGRTLGLQVDSVDGLIEVACADVKRLHHDDHAEEVFHSAARVPGSDAILSVLDVGRLAALAASWHQVEPYEARADIVQAETPAGRAAEVNYALLQLDGARLGVPAGDLVEVMRMPALEQFGTGIDGNWCRWRGRHLPMLASGALAGLPHAAQAPLLAVLEHKGLALGLPVSAALALQAFAAGRDDGLVTAVYDADGQEVRLLDTASLFARFPEALLSKPDGRGAAAGAAPDGGVPNEDAYIVFAAGQRAATPIGAVAQIVPLAAGSGGATMQWNGAALPLVDLRPDHPATAAGHVLVAAKDGRHTGYVVTRVELLIPAGSARLYRLGAAPGRARSFVTVDTAAGQASYRIVDLAEA
ncbi:MULTISPECIES: chemotaxis protein CheW [unclassified Massilia]|uniref:chemotaxis protein CheW n=1 Tax=unclassified Massilia TaxID=2609279 RepID=UPI00178228D6|nr:MULTISPECIES: chemotaxis protein CheW [unclassified Massilia]MBD8533114.1 chemotaxis protein CheW [Massilia sp. CFBP 13647]MBD8676529.1 chemotaxis protein CheW [Massilia sp. CFBP 13721]